MKTLKQLLLLISFSTLGLSSWSQSDSSFFTYGQYMSIVIENHPVSKQADLKIDYGSANLQMTKGVLDPKLGGNISQKYFEGTQYYSLIDAGLKIPTWFGVDFKGGFELNEGDYLNDQSFTPDNGLIYAGISIPIGQGLIIDKRRVAIKKAKLYQNATISERAIILNNLLFEAGSVYWQWYRANKELQIFQNALDLAENRYDAVYASAYLGDRPFIDTIEAGLQVQNRLLQVQQSQLVYKNTSALLSIFLWDNEGNPLELEENTFPQIKEVDYAIPVDSALYLQLDTLIEKHPELVLYENKLDQLEIEKKWNKEQLKPKLNFNYNPITQPVGGDLLGNYSINNYKWGVEVSMPILLREERGRLTMTNIEINETQLEQDFKRQSLIYKAITALNEWQNSFDQVQLYQRTVNDSKALLEGERKLFQIGESSLFMVNSRETYYIQSQQKLIELIMKNRIAELKTRYAFAQIE